MSENELEKVEFTPAIEIIKPKFEPQCWNCKWSVAMEPLNLKADLKCIGAPPTPIVVGMGPTGPVISSYHPSVRRGYYCGKHEYKTSGNA